MTYTTGDTSMTATRPYRSRIAMGAMSAVLAALVTLAPLASPLGAQATRGLAAPTPEALRGKGYGVEFTQTMAFQGERAGNAIGRETRLRVTFDAGQRRGNTNEAVVRVDTARGSLSTPHNREVLDLRNLQNTRFTITYGDSGAPATWPATPAGLAFGDGSEIPFATLLGQLIPALPMRAARTGDTWERSWTRRSMNGQERAQHAVTTRYTLEAITQSAGTRVARVRFVTTSGAGAPPVFKSGGTMLVGADDGVLRELTLEESSTGNWDFNGEMLPFIQTDVTKLVLRDATGAAPAHR